jgi:hypothetical protein
MMANWADGVRAAIANLGTKTGRVLGPDQALALIDAIVEGKLTADELARIHGIPHQWIKTTLGHITGAVGSGRVRSLETGGWYKFRGYEQPYDVAPGFAAAWKKARDLPDLGRPLDGLPHVIATPVAADPRAHNNPPPPPVTVVINEITATAQP